MRTLTRVEPCEPPAILRERSSGPSIPIDHQILAYVAGAGPAQLSEITRAVGGTTHHVHARVQTLITRECLRRDPVPGGPRRGPGASLYTVTDRGRLMASQP